MDMDRLLEENVETAWRSLSHHLRSEIQRIMGFSRENVSAEELAMLVLRYVGPKLHESKTRRWINEAVDTARSQIQQETRIYVDQVGKESMDYLKQIAEGIDARDRRILYHLNELRAQQSLPSSAERAALPAQPPQPNVYISTPVKNDCPYVKDGGPKNCIVVNVTPDGTYGTCLTGHQVREKQIVHRWFTSAFESTGCPSNKQIKPCVYYLQERVKIS